MRIAVVILNWNGKALLEKFLPSVTQYSKEARVYVADNASTDDSIAFVTSRYPEVSLLQNEVNGGYAKGYNDALRHLDEDVFILLNSDVEVTPNWLRPIIQEFEQHPNTAAVQPKILDYRKRDQFEYAGAAGGYLDMFAYPYCRGRIFDSIEKDEGQYNDRTRIFWASGACLAIRKEDFYRAGGLDEDYFAHQEEIDLCWRLFNLNRDIMYIGSSVIYHLGGATLDSMNPRKTFFNFRNSLFSLVKNAAGRRVWFLIFSRLILDGVAGVKFFLQFRLSHTLAIIKAHFSFYSYLGKMLKKRQQLPQKKYYYQVKSILFEFYGKGRKSYWELNKNSF